MTSNPLRERLLNEAEWLHVHLAAGDWVAAQHKTQNLLVMLQELTGKERVTYQGGGPYAQ